MAQQTINVGTSPNDGSGDPLRTGGQKANANFTELYSIKEDVANKSGDTTFSSSSDTLYPSQRSVSSSLATKEIIANKSTDTTLSSNSDIFYPSQKAVKTYVDAHSVTVPGEITNHDGWAIEFFDDYNTGLTSSLNMGVGWNGNGTGSATGSGGTTIVTRTIYGSQTEKRLSLKGAEYGRKFYWGNDWIKIQLALLARISGSATFNGEFRFGVCSGITNMYTSSTCTNFVGLTTATGNGNNFTLSTGTRNNVFTSTFSAIEGKRNTTIVSQSSGAGSAGRRLSATEGFRHVIWLDITRGAVVNPAVTGSSYTFLIKWTESTSQDYNCGKKQFLTLLDDSALFSWFTTTQTITFNWDETTGGLDAMNINWSNATNSLELCAVACRRQY